MEQGRGFDPLMIESRIRTYASFGHHRTGWPADDRTTAWLRDELRAAGIDAAKERFPFPRLEVRSAALTWDDERIEGEPMYDGGLTAAGGVIGKLREASEDDRPGAILFAAEELRGDRRWNATEVAAHYESLASEGVAGVVVPSGDPLGELMLRDAVHIDNPFALPVLVIARRDVRRLSPALLMQIDVTLEVDADRLHSTATNVTATIPGDDPSAAPLVLSTPKSGWFACAGERGTGLAAWLAIAEAVAAMPSRRRTVHLVATSGHELNQHGMRAYLEARPNPRAGGVLGPHRIFDRCTRHHAARRRQRRTARGAATQATRCSLPRQLRMARHRQPGMRRGTRGPPRGRALHHGGRTAPVCRVGERYGGCGG